MSWWTFRIFPIFFFCSGVGQGRSRPSRWPGGRFLLEIRREGGYQRRRRGGGGRRRWEQVCREEGGANYFFRGRNAHQVVYVFSCFLVFSGPKCQSEETGRVEYSFEGIVMPLVPHSEIQGRFGPGPISLKTLARISANFFADFRHSISREDCRKEFHPNSSLH